MTGLSYRDEIRAGILTEIVTRHVHCDTCDWHGELDLMTTDGRTAEWHCDACDTHNQIEVNP